MILALGKRLVHFVAHAVVERQMRHAQLVLAVDRIHPRRSVEVRIAGGLPVLHREAEKEIGRGAAGVLTRKGEVAVRPVDE